MIFTLAHACDPRKQKRNTKSRRGKARNKAGFILAFRSFVFSYSSCFLVKKGASDESNWALRVSNPRPPRCKRGALATELSAPIFRRSRIEDRESRIDPQTSILNLRPRNVSLPWGNG